MPIESGLRFALFVGRVAEELPAASFSQLFKLHQQVPSQAARTSTSRWPVLHAISFSFNDRMRSRRSDFSREHNFRATSLLSCHNQLRATRHSRMACSLLSATPDERGSRILNSTAKKAERTPSLSI